MVCQRDNTQNNYLDAVVAFLVYDGDVTPAHAQHNLDHCFDLMVIGWNGTRKILEALLVAQLRTGREERDLLASTTDSGMRIIAWRRFK